MTTSAAFFLSLLPATFGLLLGPSPVWAEEPELASTEQAKMLAIVQSVRDADARRFSADRVADNYHAAVDAKARWLALAEFQDPRIPRDGAVRVLTAALADADLSVRIYASMLLYKLGSPAGKDTLLAALLQGPTLPEADLPLALEAAKILDSHYETIPREVLLALRPRFQRRELNGVMARQGDPTYLPYLMPNASAGTVSPGTVWNLAILAAPESGALVRDIFASTSNPITKVAAAWAMYRIDRDAPALEYVLQVAAQSFDAPKLGARPDDAVDFAWRAIRATRHERARDLLRRAVELMPSRSFTADLTSLYFVQCDYEFVDHYLTAYLSDRKSHPHADIALIARLVAARNSPELNRLAAQMPEGARKFYFEPMRAMPPEYWNRDHSTHLPASDR
jgi:hypothetical protein